MFQMPLEVVKLLETAASHPEGEDALFEGHLESVAALYQVHPQTIEELRTCVEQPAGQVKAAQIVERARLNPTVCATVASVRPEGDPVVLIAKAAMLLNGLELLTRGPIETAALLLGTHPFVVDEARLQLAARSRA